MLDRARLWLRSALLRRRLEREMREEMVEHLERSTERLMARGLSPEEARREALREFGNVTYHQEQAREARGTAWLDAFAADVRFALRHLARTPGTTVVMLVVLAVGMSISTLLFSYVHSYAVQPPPGIAREDDLVRIRGSRSAGEDGRGYRVFSEEEVLAYRDLTDHFRAVAGWTDQQVLLDAGRDAGRRGLRARVTFVTRNYFSVIGVQPMIGAGLQEPPSDDAAMAAVAVLGHTAWDLLFGRSPDVIGSTVAVNGVPVTIVGVAPESFDGWPGYSMFQLWMPLSARDLLTPEPSGGFRAVGRLRAGVNLQEATAAVQVVAARFAADDADAEEARARDPSTEVVPLLAANGDPMFEQDVRLMSFSLGLLGLLVLLVTCTNVSSLLTGLATARRQEMAVRLSMGAGRTRLIRQLLTESAMLACVAGAAALALVWLVLGAVNERIPAIPLELGVDWAATTFTFGIALAVGVLFGLSPALHATRLAVASVLRDSAATAGATRARLQRGLVVAQVAFTQPLIVLLAAVLVLTLGQFRPERRTAVPERVVALSLRFLVPPSADAAPEAEQRLRVATSRLIERLEGTPGVEAVVPSWRSINPLGSYVVHPDDATAGAPRDALPLSAERVAEGYFDLMGIPVVRGRSLTSSDADATGPDGVEVPVVISDDLARRLWGTDPVGYRLRPASDTATNASILVVVGVVDDPLAETREAGEAYQVYLPPGADWVSSEMLLRTAGPAEPLLPDIRRIAQEEASGMAAEVHTLAQSDAFERRNLRLITSGLLTAGLMALLLSAIGLYAVVAFSVGQRSNEIAVRMAMGARSGQVVGRFVGDGLRLGALGLLLGLPISLVGLRWLMSVPDIPSVALPPVTAMAAVGVVAVAAAAAWLPARRAAAVDPAVTLRSE